VWVWTYSDCESVLKSEQPRQRAFAAVRACVPDLFPKDLLIFLPNIGTSSEWAAIRGSLHNMFLDEGLEAYRARVEQLPSKLSEEWLEPKLEDMDDIPKVQRMVSKCIFWVFFGEWVTDAEAEVLRGWRTHATYFVLPRLMHRFLFNAGINKVKTLRVATVGIIEKYGLQDKFEQMNDNLPIRWRRKEVVKLCDEIMYAVGFAGIGGTCAACESMGCFLQAKIPPESAVQHIKWGVFDTEEKMVAKYKENPERYIKETCRLDPPVTSATSALKDATTVSFNGVEHELPAGVLNQYVVSMANRDPAVFNSAEIFDPDRKELNQALTWNGRFGAGDETDFPRICPGRNLSMQVIKAICNHALGLQAPAGSSLSPFV